jgi:hypothetical protein
MFKPKFLHSLRLVINKKKLIIVKIQLYKHAKDSRASLG